MWEDEKTIIGRQIKSPRGENLPCRSQGFNCAYTAIGVTTPPETLSVACGGGRGKMLPDVSDANEQLLLD